MQSLKKAFKEANKSLEEQKIKRFKQMILATLQKIDKLESLVREYQRQIKILKKDIEDCKAGRLDRIQERQSKDPRAKEVSLIKVDEVIHNDAVDVSRLQSTPMFDPYQQFYLVWNNTNNSETTGFTSLIASNKFVRTYTSGTYTISETNIKYI